MRGCGFRASGSSRGGRDIDVGHPCRRRARGGCRSHADGDTRNRRGLLPATAARFSGRGLGRWPIDHRDFSADRKDPHGAKGGRGAGRRSVLNCIRTQPLAQMSVAAEVLCAPCRQRLSAVRGQIDSVGAGAGAAADVERTPRFKRSGASDQSESDQICRSGHPTGRSSRTRRCPAKLESAEL